MELTMKHASRGFVRFRRPVTVAASACLGGKLEKEGPYGRCLDLCLDADDLHTDSFEKAEAEMARRTVAILLAKARLADTDVDLLVGGDLMNQCTATAYGLASFDIPYMGLYGACSTFALGLLTAASLIDAGDVRRAVVCASSHFCTAERQFRFPPAYGSVPTPTSQTTVTGVGAVLLTADDGGGESRVTLTDGLFGRVSDSGVNDGANMGAAMATAASDSIARYLAASGEDLRDFDAFATGDLGSEGQAILAELLEKRGLTADGVLCDCGEMIYDRARQSVGCGGSGCGCSAVMTAGYFAAALREGTFRRAALGGTGALMSPQSLKQGLSIPAVCHVVAFKREE